jgi:hypothetical protein
MVRKQYQSSAAPVLRIPGRTPVWFWVLGAALVAYVALCTAQRDRIWEADAWEHDRAIRAFVLDPVAPGNPTYATGDPSIRYSVYTVALASLVRATKVDAFDALSLAAVFNTALLVMSVWLLLRRFGESAAAGCVLIAMIGLWGGPPGYANSYALGDLPWHQVNPSAFSFPLVVCVWAMFLRAEWANVPGMMLLSSLALNSHPMTGACGLYAMLLLALNGPRKQLKLQLLRFGLVVLASFLACAVWPWFDFIGAMRSHRDQLYWFNSGIVRLMLLEWCAPALLGGVLSLLVASRDSVRRCLLCAAGVFALTVFTLPLRSATLARFPMPGMIFAHIAIGVMLHESRPLDWRTWRARIRSVLGKVAGEAPPAAAIVELAVACMLLFYTLPQVAMIPTEWHLGKAYLAQLLHRSDANHPHLKPRFDRLLAGIVQARDVVLSDPVTSWPLPTSGGRIVAAVHYEAYVDGQDARFEDARAFFGDAHGVDRQAILERYGVRYIVLNREQISQSAWDGLLNDRAVLRQEAGLVLMSAELWRQQSSEGELATQTRWR